MPTYDYKCLECGYLFEEFQNITAEPLTSCPKCSGNVKRLIGAGAGPLFKGSGFYHTDYKMNSSNTSKSKEGNKSAPKSETNKASNKD